MEKYCVVKFYLNKPLKNGKLVIEDGFAKLIHADNDYVEIKSKYDIPTNKISDISVCLIEGNNSKIIINSAKETVSKDVCEKIVRYDFKTPTTSYRDRIIKNASIIKHLNNKTQKKRECDPIEY